ncbi:hypothetical protein [Nocardia cyriacigeorgica]|uniref:hypothetical protein n=1 Tax=Nocardia cyriacigeorgica TaxID=135487 RepID=UPI00245796AF|nr:hypothetical protein [Nocardia cyriacigeorgica]
MVHRRARITMRMDLARVPGPDGGGIDGSTVERLSNDGVLWCVKLAVLLITWNNGVVTGL